MTIPELTTYLRSYNPVSRESMIVNVKSFLGGSLIYCLDTHNTRSVIFEFSDTGTQKYIIKMEFGTDNAVSRESEWYTNSTFHHAYKTPEYITSNTESNYSYLILEYLENASTIDELAQSDNVGSPTIQHYVSQALHNSQNTFEATKQRASTVEFFEKKFAVRSKQASELSYLKQLLSSKTYRVNDIEMRSPAHYIKIVNENRALREYLTPNFVGKIHGDLHCGNILIKENDIYVVDPRGVRPLPIEYDIGKLLHSVHGQYGSIMSSHYRLTEIGEYTYLFNTQTPDSYIDTANELRKSLSDQLFLSSMYAEAIHFVTMLPHHANKETETTALFLRGIETFNELFNYLGVKGNATI